MRADARREIGCCSAILSDPLRHSDIFLTLPWNSGTIKTLANSDCPAKSFKGEPQVSPKLKAVGRLLPLDPIKEGRNCRRSWDPALGYREFGSEKSAVRDMVDCIPSLMGSSGSNRPRLDDILE